MQKVRSFTVSVSYKDKAGRDQEEIFPVKSLDYSTATSLAFTYALRILKLQDFELRMVGA